LLPLELSVGRAAVQLRIEPCLNNQAAGVHWHGITSSELDWRGFRGP
jgi:hypothetical protein